MAKSKREIQQKEANKRYRKSAKGIEVSRRSCQKYRDKNKMKITCSCGKEISKLWLYRHQQTSRCKKKCFEIHVAKLYNVMKNIK